MTPDPWLLGALAFSFLLLAGIGLLSAWETALHNVRRSRLPLATGDTQRIARVETLLDAPDRFLASAHLAKSMAESLLYASAALAGLDLVLAQATVPATLPDLLAVAWPGIVGAALIAYLAVTLVGETLPKAHASRRPELVLLSGEKFIRVFTLLFTPLHWLTRAAGQLLARIVGAPPPTTRAAHSEEEIKLLVEGSAEEGVLEQEEKEMIHSIFEFTDTVARQVMVPRIDICSVQDNATLGDAVELALRSGHSRLPVCAETLDTIVGVIHVKDLLPDLVEGRLDAPVRPLLREPFFVPEGKKIDELLQEFRAHKSQLAIVVDEFGGTAGLVTIEDVVEEIVGEIQDEYDVDVEPTAAISKNGDGAIVDARMTVADVNEALGLELPVDDYDTLGGFVFSLFGRAPNVGEQVVHESLLFVAEAIDGLRLQKIRIIPTDRSENGDTTAREA
jgi:putative hemolysin